MYIYRKHLENNCKHYDGDAIKVHFDALYDTHRRRTANAPWVISSITQGVFAVRRRYVS